MVFTRHGYAKNLWKLKSLLEDASIWQIILTSTDILRFICNEELLRVKDIVWRTNLQKKKTRENSTHISPFDIFRRLNLQRHFTVHLRWRTPSCQSHCLEHIAQCPQRCSPDQAGTPHQPFQTERYLAQCGHCLQTIEKSRGRRTGRKDLRRHPGFDPVFFTFSKRFKLLAGKFTWGNKAKHRCQQKAQANFPAHRLLFKKISTLRAYCANIYWV